MAMCNVERRSVFGYDLVRAHSYPCMCIHDFIRREAIRRHYYELQLRNLSDRTTCSRFIDAPGNPHRIGNVR